MSVLLSEDCSRSGKISALTAEPNALILFLLLLPHLNRHGKAYGDPFYIKGLVVPDPFWPTYNIANIAQFLAEINEKTNVKWFRADNELFYIHSLNYKIHNKGIVRNIGIDKLPSYNGEPLPIISSFAAAPPAGSEVEAAGGTEPPRHGDPSAALRNNQPCSAPNSASAVAGQETAGAGAAGVKGASPDTSQHPAPVPAPLPKKAKAEKPSIPNPNDFEPASEDIAFGLSIGLDDIEVDYQSGLFKTYATKRAEKPKDAYKNLHQAFRNWLKSPIFKPAPAHVRQALERQKSEQEEVEWQAELDRNDKAHQKRYADDAQYKADFDKKMALLHPERKMAIAAPVGIADA